MFKVTDFLELCIVIYPYLFYCFRVTDLIVAAPFYFNKAEGGAVYVYTALDMCKTLKDAEKCLPVKLVGREESRFILHYILLYINVLRIDIKCDKLIIDSDLRLRIWAI